MKPALRSAAEKLTVACLATWALLAAPRGAQAATDTPLQEHITQAVDQLLKVQTVGYPGRVSWSVGTLEPRLALTPCAKAEAFMPSGARLWGQGTVGVRCTQPQSWSVYLPVTLRIMAPVVVAARALPMGRALALEDLMTREADLGQMPVAVALEPQQVVGRITTLGLPAGQPLRLDLLRAPNVVLQGQSVLLVAQGSGFRISAEGKALANAADGQVIQVRTESGRSIQGLAREGGIVEISGAQRPVGRQP